MLAWYGPVIQQRSGKQGSAHTCRCNAAGRKGSRDLASSRTHRPVFELLPKSLTNFGNYVHRRRERIANKKFGDLSGGQRQRVLFALAICGDPDLLFLDEPTVGLDVEARRMLWAEIRKMISRGKTVLLTTHYLEEADALADRVVVINRGSVIAEGSPADIKRQAAGRRIRCVSSLDVAVVRRVAGVVDVRQDREALRSGPRKRNLLFANSWPAISTFPGLR